MRERVNFNFRIKKELRETFKKAVTEKGFSTCFILETLIQAWLAAAPPTQKANPGASITVNQKIEYLVDRPRRKKRFTEPLDNCYSIKAGGLWIYRVPEKGEILSRRYNHVHECQCSACKPSEGKAARYTEARKQNQRLEVCSKSQRIV